MRYLRKSRGDTPSRHPPAAFSPRVAAVATGGPPPVRRCGSSSTVSSSRVVRLCSSVPRPVLGCTGTLPAAATRLGSARVPRSLGPFRGSRFAEESRYSSSERSDQYSTLGLSDAGSVRVRWPVRRVPRRPTPTRGPTPRQLCRSLTRGPVHRLPGSDGVCRELEAPNQSDRGHPPSIESFRKELRHAYTGLSGKSCCHPPRRDAAFRPGMHDSTRAARAAHSQGCSRVMLQYRAFISIKPGQIAVKESLGGK